MDFRKSLESTCFCLELQGTTKDAVIAEMVDLLVGAGKIQDRDAALRAVIEREQRMSTGMQYGVAVPHGKTSTVDHLVTLFALKREGIEFDSLDKLPARIFVMTISSNSRTGPHIQYLAEMSKFLCSPDIRERLLRAQTEEEIKKILSE
jgi:mannitol/fructose-specific phosphotransferase system IIA component (Ntr-type)